MAFGRKPAALLQHLFPGFANMEHIMDEHESNAEPNAAATVEVTRRTVIATGQITLDELLSWLPVPA
jgi:hypothetical protein